MKLSQSSFKTTISNTVNGTTYFINHNLGVDDINIAIKFIATNQIMHDYYEATGPTNRGFIGFTNNKNTLQLNWYSTSTIQIIVTPLF